MEIVGNDDRVPMPSSLEEVEALITRLYQPGSTHQITGIQETLQKLQRSNDGWRLANLLLASSDEKVKFFGALTFIVKLNSDGSSLNDADSKALLNSLIGWLIESSDRVGGQLVTKKLCSALVTFFLHFSSTWSTCVKHIMTSLAIGKALPLESLDPSMPATGIVRTMRPESLLTAIWFSTILVEEVMKTDANSMRSYKYHEKLLINVVDAVALMGNCISTTSDLKLRQEAMRCFQSWVNYSHRAFIDEGSPVLEPLRALTMSAISCLEVADMYQITAELFADILANYSRFLTKAELQQLSYILRSQWAKGFYDELVLGDFSFENLQFGQLLIAFGDATVQDLVKMTDDDSQHFLTILGGLLNAQGYAVAEDQIFVQALEFWSTFVEVVIDSLYSDEDHQSAWIPPARNQIMKVIESCMGKIQFPSQQEFGSWDSTDQVGFMDTRKDVADLLQSSYTLTGPPLFATFVQLALQSLENNLQYRLEASLFCIGALSDFLSDDKACDVSIDSLFESPIFEFFSDSTISQQTKKTFLSTLELYAGYLERRPATLLQSLAFLFQSVENSVLANKASKTIQSLCYSCRRLLSPHLDTFIQQYDKNITSVTGSDGIIKERIIGAIAAVIQGLPLDEAKVSPLKELLGFVETEIQNCLSYARQEDEIAAEACALQSLRSLASIARALQAPNDTTIDLETAGNGNSFWCAGGGAVLQDQIKLQISTVMTTLPERSEIIEAACSIFRFGFSEKEGLFVLPAEIVVEFLLIGNSRTPRLGVILGTACSFVSSQDTEANPDLQKTMTRLLERVVSLMRDLEDPAEDPEISQNVIDFFHRLLSTHASIFIGQSPSTLENIFLFTLRTLTGRNPLPKTSAADFWSTFVSLKDQRDEVQLAVDTALQHVGPMLAQAIIYNVGGGASRSELDKLADPLKKLVVRQVRAKTWLELALFHESFPSSKVSESDKRVFLQKVINLRGARATNAVVKDFWLACRGSSFAYAS